MSDFEILVRVGSDSTSDFDDIVADAGFPDLGGGVNLTNTRRVNITNKGEMALACLSPKDAVPLKWLDSTADVLQAWDVSTNGSILMGKSTNSVYSYSITAAQSHTYYPIGGDGGPLIAVHLATLDAWTESPTKCIDNATYIDGKYKSFEIISADGDSFCMPYWVGAYSRLQLLQGEAYSLPLEDLGDMSDKANWRGYLFGRYREANDLSFDMMNSSVKEAMVQLITGMPLGMGNIEGNRVYNSTSAYKGMFPWATDRDKVHYAVARGGFDEWMEIKVPWSTSVIQTLQWDLNAFDSEARRMSDIEEAIAYTSDGAMPTDGPGTTPDRLLKYKFDQILERWLASSPPQENEYEIVYSTLEAEGLIRKFGTTGPVGEVLNSIFMGMANYLVSTYIESVYTFKTIKMPAIGANIITPTSLSTQASSVSRASYASTSTPYTSESYYPSSYGAREGLTTPTDVDFYGPDSVAYGFHSIDSSITDDYTTYESRPEGYSSGFSYEVEGEALFGGGTSDTMTGGSSGGGSY